MQRTLSLYVHVPFCSKRCGYCDFNTYTPAQVGLGAVQAYLDAAHNEIDIAWETIGDGRKLDTVFFGGGTPTLLDTEALGGLLAHAKECFGFSGSVEITTEANPETLDDDVLEHLLSAGFNRLSIGMQSSDETVLGVLDRVHQPGRAVQAAKRARQIGFSNISLDLIYGTPGESLESWRSSLLDALSAGPDHISAYSLIVEDGTPLARRIKKGKVAKVDEDDLADKYLLADELLSEAGLENYETSNWAKDGFESRHNIAYWLGGDWWGIGPGAHSHLADKRWWNVKRPLRYAEQLHQNGSAIEGSETLDEIAKHEEEVLLRMRLKRGLELRKLSASEASRVQRFIDQGLLEKFVSEEGQMIRASQDGRLLIDGIVVEILD
ncbi:radical SAM family heme chaperone HemW [Propionimicrobium sp. BV2F7]|uniref:radical SAM family heme chaperone HemW n=1 Tax=Propionimicrobium sp. BV2F7 TaxID=1111131 RepID=UPI0003D79B42|nr:radical SAM family heme chaperone HemW [Propionimicrobium sp. BV2F7]ETJ97856.1 putative coproporphyrinogen dehydrogenase [Propionimicrobium sp. BV2F7]